jgi:heptosyltransferase-1
LQPGNANQIKDTDPAPIQRAVIGFAAHARAVVGVDTGLTHLAAALSVPTVALFAATPAWRFGPYWSERAVSLGEDGHWPEPDEVLAALARLAAHG